MEELPGHSESEGRRPKWRLDSRLCPPVRKGVTHKLVTV